MMAKTLRAQEPIAPYVADEDKMEAKLFANGRSQAIRLPKEFRMPGDRVLIHREGKRLIVEPVEVVERDALGHRVGFWEEIQELCKDITDEEWDEIHRTINDDPVPPPIEEEMKRWGMDGDET